MQGEKAESNENTYFQQFARRKRLVCQAKLHPESPAFQVKCLIINALQEI